MSLGGLISNLLLLGAKLLPAVKHTAIQSLSSCSSPSLPPVDGSQKIETELEALMKMLERIKATLYDAEQREIREKSVELWLKELKRVAHDAEDVLDEYHYEVLCAQVEARNPSLPDSRKRKLIQVPDGMFDQIQKISNTFAEICKDRIALQLSEADGRKCFNSEVQKAPTSHFVDESGIFGREREKKELIDMLLTKSQDDKVVSVVAIVGPGGLGKTTLAQLAYNDQRIKQGFNKFGWICVSDNFDVERLTKESIESITGKAYSLQNLSALQNKIGIEIKAKRVLIILDDVWNEKSSLWELFHAPFKSASFAKFLVTTRNEPVARVMQTMPTFNLHYLSNKHSWRMFKHYALGGHNQSLGSNLVEIGKQIIKKCGMLPLAVKSIASLLRHEWDEESWREILESELWETNASNEIFPPLQLSYAHLPTYLKLCFIFCSMFPKDYEYNVEHLVQLWISQGYIESKGKKSAEEVGFDYGKQLWQRSFFESGVEWNYSKSQFKLHDMMHDLARFNSKNGCFSIEDAVTSKLQIFSKELCHLFVQYGAALNKPIEPIPFDKLTALRTLIIIGFHDIFKSSNLSQAQKLRALKIDVYQNPKLDFFSRISDLKYLRYLSLGRLPYGKLPSECISSLHNLLTLELVCCSINELPTSITNLVSLEELIIIQCPYLKELPESFCQLKTMRKLRISFCEQLEKLPPSIGNLVGLEILEMKSCHFLKLLPGSLCRLRALKKLIVSNCNKIEELPSSMGSLAKLQNLKIDGCRICSLPSSLGKIVEILTLSVSLKCETIGWLRDFCDLGGTLNLIGLKNMSNLNDVQCANVASMHKLESLWLEWEMIDVMPNDDNQFFLYIGSGHNMSLEDQNDYTMMEGFQPHPNLRELRIDSYRGSTFPKWIGDPSSLESLEKLSINYCKTLMFLPLGGLRKLRYLRIGACYSLQIITAESLPLELQELIILGCDELISVPGIQKLKSLVKLQILDCARLQLLLMDVEPSVELTMHTNESSYRNSLLGLRNLTALKSLQITRCPKLQLLADELLCVESCEVEVQYCPLLREWCLQHRKKHKDIPWEEEEEEEEEEGEEEEGEEEGEEEEDDK